MSKTVERWPSCAHMGVMCHATRHRHSTQHNATGREGGGGRMHSQVPKWPGRRRTALDAVLIASVAARTAVAGVVVVVGRS